MNINNKTMKRIYLDHAATTPVDKEVFKAMQPYFSEKFGNASTLYDLGKEAENALEKSRKVIARAIGARANEIIFTSGGTESNNLAIKGVAFANKSKGNHIITSKIEHRAILEPCHWLEKHGFKVTYLDVDKNGFVKPEQIKKAITGKTILVSIMHANNEIGTVEPIAEIGKICKKHKVYFHTDAVQSFGKIPINVKKMSIDLLSASSHKIYGPKGVGMLYINRKVNIEPIIHGGHHEYSLRSGTENIPGIVGFAKAAELCMKRMKMESEREKRMRDKLIREISKIKDSHLNGHPTQRLPNNVNFWFKGIKGDALLFRLNEKNIYTSTQSACSSHELKPSHVLTAIGLTAEQSHGSLRLTLGKDNTKRDIDYVLKILPKIVNSLRKISLF